MWSLRSSLDGYAADLGTLHTDAGSTGGQSIPLGDTFKDLTQNVTFRIYGFAAPSIIHTLGGWPISVSIPIPSTGTGAIDNVGVGIVPEPGQVGLVAALGLAGFGLIRRKVGEGAPR